MIPHFLRVALIVIEVVILFNLLIAVHELGHFLAAKWRGLYIEQFGIWFGKPIWKKKINGVLYSIGSIPAGGFVKLPQLAPMDVIEGEADVDRAQLPPISALDKIIVAIAGPLFSILLALAFACVVWAVGHPVNESEATTVIGYVEKDSPAERAGLLPGDHIIEVDGRPVTRFAGMNNSVVWNVVRSEGATIPFKVERDGALRDFSVTPYRSASSGWRRKPVRQVLILPAVTPIVDEVQPNTPAAAAGLQHGDVIRSVNGQRIFHPEALADYIAKHPTELLTLEVLRDGKLLHPQVTPASLDDGKGGKTPRIGIRWDAAGRTTISHPDPIEQVYNSIAGTLNTLGAVASRKSDIGLQHMSGPVGIGHIYYLLFQSERGWQMAIWFSVVLNVNLAILNMLPIPVLDGGHIVLAIVESIRRKPVNTRILEFVQTACAVLIIGYVAYVSFFDIGDILGKDPDAAPAKSAPAQKR